MAEKRYYWLKLKEDYFSSPKIKKLRKIAGGDTYTIIYLKMQLLSVKNQGIIQFENIEPTFVEELSLMLDEDVDNVAITLEYLKTQGLIEENNNEYLFVEATNNIGTESASAERVRRFRERKEDLKLDNALHCNASVTEVKRDYISISSSISKSNKFIKPTIEEVDAYCKERNNGIDAENFIAFYDSKGWVIGKSPMKNWKSAIVTWEKRNKNKSDKDFANHNYTKTETNSIYDNIDDTDL